MTELTAHEMEELKSRFREAGCEVRPLEDPHFEIVSNQFPVRTHVYANPLFLELGTMLVARGKGSRAKAERLLQEMNQKSKVAKFTLESEKWESDYGGWKIMAIFRLVTGSVGTDHDPESLRNLVMLWCQDIAEVILISGSFEIVGMIEGTEVEMESSKRSDAKLPLLRWPTRDADVWALTMAACGVYLITSVTQTNPHAWILAMLAGAMIFTAVLFWFRVSVAKWFGVLCFAIFCALNIQDGLAEGWKFKTTVLPILGAILSTIYIVRVDYRSDHEES